jgi:primosomal protein N' (replication factor Y) (superfamily II helicase)
LLPDELMELARWIAGYYVAPLGEVLRGMLPLGAEVKRHFCYRITEVGRKVLYEGAEKGASRRSKLSAEDQNREYAVLNYLEGGEAAKLSAIRSATNANKGLLEGMVRKRWLVREAVAEERDARRLEKVAVLVERDSEGVEDNGRSFDSAQDGTFSRSADISSSAVGRRLPKLNENQLAVMAELTAVGGRARVLDLQERMRRGGVPDSTLGTLVKRGLVRIEEVAEDFHFGGVHSHGKKHAHEHALNEAQMEALGTIVAAMVKGGFAPHLMYGVTGSGKTAVYFAAMRRALDAGKSALLLVPEIGLTPAMTGQLVAAFGDEVALLHSQLTPDERAEQWHRIRRGEARVVVGTRSAVFAPLRELGLIIVDEEHDGSYKQEETPRYHGRDVAVMRAKLNEAAVVLGSATPSLESWANAEKGRYARVEMRERVADRPLPAVELVDMRQEFRETGQEQIFSRRLIEETEATIARGEQVIILLNRRGYSFVVMCRSCGEKIECENCAISMTYHKPVSDSDGVAQPGQRLECHYCGFRRGVPKVCPKCESEHLYYMGVGSQQGEERLQEIFPQARIGRMDRDTVRGRSDMERLLARLHAGEINLLVGTQMIAKGHDIHGVTLVGVVGADFALGLPDFRAAERVFQLLTQVSGRAGRGELPGKVLVQTYHPEHYAVKFAQGHDYPGFVAKEMQYRRWMHYPPYAVLANVVIQSERLEEATGWSSALGRWFQQTRLERVRVLGPAAAPIVRLKRIYRYHFVLKAERRQDLGAALRAMLRFAETQEIPRRNLVVDVDAVHLM